MSGRIPRPFIDELLARTDIVEVIDERVPLRKTGSNYSACCPFHTEKTPSFSVSPDKQFYYCFGCGASGNAIGFLMEYDHLGFVEAVENLAARAGLQVPREGGENAPREDHRGLYDLLEQAARWFQRQLREHPQAPRAKDYLKRRGLTGELAKQFGLGYAPDGWDHLLRALGGSDARPLVQAGLVIERDEDGHRYDRFRNRVMFPIRDQRGRVIGFGGRVLGDDTPKYLNSPETPVFHKGRELYGLYEARQSERHPERLLVVEGYMDVLALAQHGFPGTVATLGTATTPQHLERLFRLVPEVVFCFDGDAAGRKAAWKALEVALPFMREGHQARFLFLPEGEDPDTLVRQEGQSAFAGRLGQATPLSTFLLEGLGQQTDLDSLDGRARLVELARPHLARIPPGIYRNLLQEQLARVAQTDVGSLGTPPPRAEPDPRQPAPRRRSNVGITPVRLCITLLLQHPELAADAESPEELRSSPVPGAPLLAQLLELFRSNPHLTPGAALEHWRDLPEYGQLRRLLSLEPLIPDSELASAFQGNRERIRQQQRELRLEELSGRMLQGVISREELQEFTALKAGRTLE